jgi:hypothetical protein
VHHQPGGAELVEAAEVLYGILLELVGAPQRHERSGAPERPPAAGEYRCACGVLDGEARDDVAEEPVGEGAEAVEIDDIVEVRTLHGVERGVARLGARVGLDGGGSITIGAVKLGVEGGIGRGREGRGVGV